MTDLKFIPINLKIYEGSSSSMNFFKTDESFSRQNLAQNSNKKMIEKGGPIFTKAV